nr:hypothetical protein [Saccharopolyspora rosea]
MKSALRRTTAGAALAGLALLGLGTPALADAPPPAVVDEPDTSQLNNLWTFAPLGVPVFGLVQSVVEAPQKVLPSE